MDDRWVEWFALMRKARVLLTWLSSTRLKWQWTGMNNEVNRGEDEQLCAPLVNFRE